MSSVRGQTHQDDRHEETWRPLAQVSSHLDNKKRVKFGVSSPLYRLEDSPHHSGSGAYFSLLDQKLLGHWVWECKYIVVLFLAHQRTYNIVDVLFAAMLGKFQKIEV